VVFPSIALSLTGNQSKTEESNMNPSYPDCAKDLLHFISQSPSAYHAISNLTAMLEGFTPLREEQEWNLQPGGSYYVTRNGSSLIAFRVPEQPFQGFQIAAAHSDSPAFKVKPNGEMSVEGHYQKLNVEKYGGMLCAPWFDRPLSVAGRIIVKEGEGIAVKLVNVDRDLLLIPNVAIHMNRKANDGMTYNPQVDLLPLFGGGEAAGKFLPIVAEAAGVDADSILETDLFLYNRMKGVQWGAENEFLSSRALDDLQCAWALTKGFLQAEKNPTQVTMCCIFDNEEVGSSTQQGADSTFLSDVLERINQCCGRTPQQLKTAVANSFMVSADNAQGVHPNHPENSDPTNRPYLNGGIVIKYNANQKYTTDGVSGGIFRTICAKAQVPVQTYVNRSDMAGGSTLGNISNCHVSLNTVDIGLAQLAMHSPYETAGVQDTEYLLRAMGTFFATPILPDGRGGYRLG
jgi:aspartyl aminopeptidase